MGYSDVIGIFHFFHAPTGVVAEELAGDKGLTITRGTEKTEREGKVQRPGRLQGCRLRRPITPSHFLRQNGSNRDFCGFRRERRELR